MAESSTPTFRLRRLAPGETATLPPSPPPPPPPPPPPRRAAAPAAPSAAAAPTAAAETDDATSGALFPSAQAALTYLGLVAGAGLADAAAARSGPDGRWWIEVRVPHDLAAPHIAAAGGRAVVGRSEAGATAAAADAPTVTDWPVATLGSLVALVRLRPALQGDVVEAVVVTGAALAGVVLRRAAAFGLTVELSPAVREPVTGGASVAAVLLRLRWTSPRPPRTLLHALARLPDTVVARPVAATPAATGAPVPGLLVEIHHHPPPAAALIAGLIPAGEVWLLGGADAGCWRVESRGPAVDGLTLLDTPRVVAAPPVVVDASAALPAAAALPVRLVSSEAGRTGAPDAVLVEDEELAWVRRFLIARPAAAETAYLLLGPGRHLLLAPGGLLETLPFGIGLRQWDHEPLLVEQGQSFHPPLPATARAAAFGAGADELVAVARAPDGGLFAARYGLSALRPVWQLWLSTPPPVVTGLSGAAGQRLAELAARLDRDRPPPPEPAAAARLSPRLRRRGSSRDALLRRALALEVAGQLVAAAELLEQAEEPARAARLYERAAGAPP